MKKYDFKDLISTLQKLGVIYKVKEKNILVYSWHSYFLLNNVLDGSKESFIQALYSALKIAFWQEGDTQLADICSSLDDCEPNNENNFLFGSKEMLKCKKIRLYSKELKFNSQKDKLEFLAMCDNQNYAARALSLLGVILPYKDILGYDYLACLYEQNTTSAFIAYARGKDVLIGDKKEKFCIFKSDIWAGTL